MNKCFALLVLMGLVATSSFAALPYGIDAKLVFGYSTDYIYRGAPFAPSASAAGFEANRKFGNDVLHLAWANNAAMRGTRTDDSTAFYGDREININLGYKMPVAKDTFVDFGTIYHWFCAPEALVDVRRELYVGAGYKGLYVNPSVYMFYDFDLDGVATELNLSHVWSLAKYGYKKAAVDASSVFGYVSYKDKNSHQLPGYVIDGYAYTRLNLGVSYKLDDKATVRTGIAYADTNNDKPAGNNQTWLWNVRYTVSF